MSTKDFKDRHTIMIPRRLPFAFLLLLFAFSLSACGSTRPVVKIGLLAPVEGLYRQDGYDALAAMRAAIADWNHDQIAHDQIAHNTVRKIDVLPLALDSSRYVARAGQKIMADPSIVSIIGPYSLADGATLGGLAEGDRWLHPYAPTRDSGWVKQVVASASAYAQKSGHTLRVAGLPAGRPEVGVSTVQRPEDVEPGQSILWLGDGAAGADFAQAVWERLPDTPFGLLGSGAALIRQRAASGSANPLFVVGWIDDEYTEWAANHTPSSPVAYTIYRQTTDTLQKLAGEAVTTVWRPAIFTLDSSGTLVLSLVR